MPTLQLKISPTQSPGRHQKLAQALTRLTAQHLGKRLEVTAVMIEDLPDGHWFVAGAEVSGATAWLEISVTAGTNSPQEKASFIAEAFAELQEQLGAGEIWSLPATSLCGNFPQAIGVTAVKLSGPGNSRDSRLPEVNPGSCRIP